MLDFKDDKPEQSAEKPSSAKDKKGSSDKKPVKEDVTKKEKVNYRHFSFLKNICTYCFNVNIDNIYFVFIIRRETRLQN